MEITCSAWMPMLVRFLECQSITVSPARHVGLLASRSRVTQSRTSTLNTKRPADTMGVSTAYGMHCQTSGLA